jgi:diacylglycerol kinase family enzyme
VYFYILESPQTARIRRIEEQILTVLRGFGIAGEVVAANPARPADELARAGLAKGYKTIVAIGGDRVINRVAAVVQGTRAAMGIIPIDAHPRIGALIGTLNPNEACEYLRHRTLAAVDVAFIDPGTYFLTEARLDVNGELPIRAHIDDVIVETRVTRLTLTGDGQLELVNDRRGASAFIRIVNRLLGRAGQPPNVSHFHGSYVKIETGYQLPVRIGGEPLARTPFVAAVKPAALKLIVRRGMVSLPISSGDPQRSLEVPS